MKQTILGLFAALALNGCNSMGPQGPTGPAGPAGDPGAMGTMGVMGAPGESLAVIALMNGDSNCPNGGTQFKVDGGSAFACNGDIGTEGPVGPMGAPGMIGPAGMAGMNGAAGAPGVAGPAVVTSVLPIGNSNCAFGGVQLTAPDGGARFACNGAPGAQGPAGAAGAAGVAGTQGVAGPTGPQGLAGAVGATGPTGAIGPMGLVGPAGAAGPAGVAGPIGLTGPTGPVGPAGATGPQGMAGVAGPPGMVGPAGAVGPAGPAGAIGPQGIQGPVGAQGLQGNAGPTGATGAVGPQGPAGTNATIAGTNNYVPKFNSANTITNSLIQENGTNVSVNVTPSPLYKFYTYNSQLTINGDGQSTLHGYRTRDSQNDGTGYAQNTTNSAVSGFNFWGDVYTFGVAGHSYNDYNRTGGVLGAEQGGTYWGSLGYRASSLLNYGVYGTAAYASGAGQSSRNAAIGIGGGFYGDLMGGWVRGDVMGLVTSGQMFAAYNVGDAYTTGHNVELVKDTTGKVNAAFTVSSTSSKVYSEGKSAVKNGTIRVNFDAAFAKLLNEGAQPTISITPVGAYANLYVASVDSRGFTVAEANGGHSNTNFNYIAVGQRTGDQFAVPAQVLARDFEGNLQGVMFNENLKTQSGRKMSATGGVVEFGAAAKTTGAAKR